MRLTSDLDRAARDRHGLVTLEDWTRAGNSRSSWFRHHGGLLVGCAPGVARAVGSAITPEQRILAALLGAGHDAVASHRSAAYLWGIDIVGDDPVDLIVGRSRGISRGRVELHRPRDAGDLRPVVRNGIPTTDPARTLLDLGAVAPDAVAPALRSLLSLGSVSLDRVSQTLDRHGARGRAGVSALRAAVESVWPEATPR